jgi:hypothetical protein
MDVYQFACAAGLAEYNFRELPEAHRHLSESRGDTVILRDAYGHAIAIVDMLLAEVVTDRRRLYLFDRVASECRHASAVGTSCLPDRI